MNFLSDALYLILVIGLLVVVHEWGHFIAARITKTRADVFSIGMGPRLFGYNKITGFTFGKLPKDWDGGGCTDYRLALFPIGGYVKIVGMVDESMDNSFASSEPQEWEFRSKNTLQKIFMLSGGVLMNTILAIAVFSFITFSQGKTIYKTTTIGYIKQASIADKTGLIKGDKIIAVNNQPVDNWEDLVRKLMLNELGKTKNLKLIRNGQEMIIPADGKMILKQLSNKNMKSSEEIIGMFPDQILTVIGTVDAKGTAAKADIQPGDTIISIDGQAIGTLFQFQDYVKSHKKQNMFFEWKHKSIVKTDTLTTNENGLIEVGLSQIFTGKQILINYNIFEAIGIGTENTYNSVILFFDTMKQIIIGNLSFKESIGGPIKIAKMASQNAEMGFLDFIKFLGMLSITLAVINFLPFPALDGGHLIFVIIESIARREIPFKVKIAIQNAGMIILLMFMAFVVYNDIVR
ncbi:MAG: RIP metalloprotease RseP [Bacteroidota bacterium]